MKKTFLALCDIAGVAFINCCFGILKKILLVHIKSHARPAILFCLATIPYLVHCQHFIEQQDSAHIDHIVDHTAFLGGGATFFDYDNDGDEDLYITAGNDRDHFYENNGDGTFAYKSVEAGFVITKIYYTTGVIAGDIDNDGFKDLFITTWFSDFEPLGKNLLYKNNGDGTFSEIWNQQEEKDKQQTMGATFIDFDLDGLLDIYTVSYVKDAAFTYDNDGNIVGYEHICYQNRFYRNLGNGEFVDKTGNVFLGDTGCSLAAVASDFDLDHDMDVYLANDFGEFIRPNKLFKNNINNLEFLEVGMSYNANTRMYGMGIAAGDIDNDLDIDYYITNFGKNVLLRNDGNIFSDITDASSAGDEWIIEDSLMTVGWGTVFLDIDNDSDLDLYVGNGYVPSPSFLNSNIFQNDKLFLNNGHAEFSDVSEAYGVENKYVTRGVSYADYDNDGDLDILAVVEDAPINDFGWATILYNNQFGNEKNWLQVSLEGIKVNRDAYGSKIYLYADENTWLHEIGGGESHASQVSSRAHFGLNDIEQVDSLKVIWTGGKKVQTVYDIEVNQHLYILEDTTEIDLVNQNELIKNQINFNISPNPSKGELNITMNNLPTKSNNGTIEIYNLLGAINKKINIGSMERNIKIGLSELPDGLYFISVKYGTAIFTERIILQKNKER
ncbi:MAG: FG-GAP-like repeat-containing protein [Bacteroidota bacterium]